MPYPLISITDAPYAVAPSASQMGYFGRVARTPGAGAGAARQAAAQAQKKAKALARLKKRCAMIVSKHTRRMARKHAHISPMAAAIYQKEMAKCTPATVSAVALSDDSSDTPVPTAEQMAFARYCDDHSVPTCFDGSYPDANGVCGDQSDPMCDDGSIPLFPSLMKSQGTTIKSPSGKPVSVYVGPPYVPPANPAAAPICNDNSVPTCDDGTLPDANNNCKNPNDSGPWCHNGTPPNWQGTGSAGMSGFGQFENKTWLLIAGAVLLFCFLRKK